MFLFLGLLLTLAVLAAIYAFIPELLPWAIGIVFLGVLGVAFLRKAYLYGVKGLYENHHKGLEEVVNRHK